MTLVSKSEFARMAGVSPQAIDQKIKKGEIDTIGEGRKSKIDCESEKAIEYLNDIPEQRERTGKKKPENPKQIKKNFEEAPEKKGIKNIPIQKPQQKELNFDLSNLEISGTYSKHDLDRMKIAVQIQKDKIKSDKERGQLIDVDIIAKAFGELYQIDINEFTQLSAALTGKICQNIFSNEDPQIISTVNKTIDDELYKTLEHIRVTLNKYLEQCKCELISGSNK